MRRGVALAKQGDADGARSFYDKVRFAAFCCSADDLQSSPPYREGHTPTRAAIHSASNSCASTKLRRLGTYGVLAILPARRRCLHARNPCRGLFAGLLKAYSGASSPTRRRWR